MDFLSFMEMRFLYGWRFFVIGYFVIFHLGTITAFWFFSWEAFLIAVSIYILTEVGLTVGYHRLLTHNSFQTFSWVRRAFALIGSFTLQSDPITWVSIHRMHHKFADKEQDPHSPIHGLPWAHILWIAILVPKNEIDALRTKYAPDLLKDPVIAGISLQKAIVMQLLLGLALLLSGWLYGGFVMALSFVLWGIFARVVFGKHFTFAVNSASHRWGYRNYPTDDKSTNNWIVALLTFGEGWHNNHHWHPTAANHGRRWWEIDPSYWVILSLKWVRLAWDVKHVP